MPVVSCYLGIDVGTSSVKAVLIDERQRPVASAVQPLEVNRPQPGWSEQDPSDWWRATERAVAALKRKAGRRLASVAGIGLSGQMHGATLLDHADHPIRPAILWNDGRSAAECAELEDEEPRLRQIAGNIAMPGFTAPKLRWVEKHEPEHFARVRKVLLPKDYVRLRLTGEHASDMSDAAGTLWLDVAQRRWSDILLAATHLEVGQMPRLYEGTQATGSLSQDLKRKWGMAQAPVVAGGGGDNAAAACGIGAVEPGQAFVSLGTSGVLFVSNAGFAPNTTSAVHAFCHAIPETWHQMGVILSATASLEWFAAILGRPAPALTRGLGSNLKGPSRVLFLPYLSGERTPVNDAAARGMFFGIGHDSDRNSLVQAVLDGVAFAFRDCLEALKAAGTRIDRATGVGGGSKSRLWLKIIATVLGIPIDVPTGGEFGAAFGAARLGLIAATGAAPAKILRPPPMSAGIEPQAQAAAAYDEAYHRYTRLYPAWKEVIQT